MRDLVLFGCKVVLQEGSAELEIKKMQITGHLEDEENLKRSDDATYSKLEKEKKNKRKNQSDQHNALGSKSGEVINLKPKKKRYRSIENIYLETKPMIVFS
ncbi:hypothetical protein A4A49_19972 [Nicotiana attenuata]|uniref:Uncharacterized protein n=1 Tax=Nicotiana attenuata TaxID=49451 RepID=A0A1J6J156_NICAT|nr:hypothetical protein A4A49_19972 [Nicotiana attenuata]